MYCQTCGAQLEESALTCSQCGRAVGAPPPPQYPYQQPYPQPYPPPYQQGYPQPYPQQPAAGTNTLALLGFVLTLFPIVPLAGFVLCIAGLSQCKRTGQSGKGLAVAGIVLNAAGFVLAVIGIIAFAAFVGSAGLNPQDWLEEFAYTVLR